MSVVKGREASSGTELASAKAHEVLESTSWFRHPSKFITASSGRIDVSQQSAADTVMSQRGRDTQARGANPNAPRWLKRKAEAHLAIPFSLGRTLKRGTMTCSTSSRWSVLCT
ncbi:hypothetical protein AOLI_G00272160 [Acnodon oligacanthus]